MSMPPSPMPAPLAPRTTFSISECVSTGDTVLLVTSNASVWILTFEEPVTHHQFLHDPAPRHIGQPEPPHYVNSKVKVSTTRCDDRDLPSRVFPESIITRGQPVSFHDWPDMPPGEMRTGMVAHVIHNSTIIF